MKGGGMRVLVVAGREPWPLNSGNRLHLYHVLRELAARADVTLALATPPVQADKLPGGVRVLCAPSGATGDEGVTLPQPLPKSTNQNPARECGARRPATCVAGSVRGPERAGGGRLRLSWIARRVRSHYGARDALGQWLRDTARAEHYDVVMLNGAVYGQLAPFCRLPFVWNPQDELVLHTLRGSGAASWRYAPRTLWHAWLYAAYERWVARQAAATIYVSPIDAAYARRWAGPARIEVVTNGVDLEYFQPDGTAPTPGTLAFVGSLEFPPNVDAICWFARRVWPTLQQTGAARRLLVVGRRPVEAVRRLAAQPGVEVAADVPDVRPYLRQAAVVVVPTRQGGGLKNKVLEACASRRAVVASPRAVAGLSARLGRDLVVAHGPGDWVRQVRRLLERPEWAAWVAGNGHAWVCRAHRWSQTGARFHEILTAAAGEPSPADIADEVSAEPRTQRDFAAPASVRPRARVNRLRPRSRARLTR